MNTNKILIAAIAILAILQVITFISVSSKKATLGSATHFSGPIDSEEGYTVDDVNAIDGNRVATLATTTVGRLVQGGQVWSTSTGSTGTSTADIVANFSVWEVTPLREGTTLNLPSTTTLYSYLDTNGQFIEFSVHNATTNAAGTLTIAKGLSLGLDLRASSTDELVIGAQNWATVKIYRDSITTSTVFVREYSSAD